MTPVCQAARSVATLRTVYQVHKGVVCSSADRLREGTARRAGLTRQQQRREVCTSAASENPSKCGTARESRHNISGKESDSLINSCHKSRCHIAVKWDRIDTPSTIDRCGAGRRESADALTKWTSQQRVRESGSRLGQYAVLCVTTFCTFVREFSPLVLVQRSLRFSRGTVTHFQFTSYRATCPS